MNKKQAYDFGYENGRAAALYGTEGFADEDEFFDMAYDSETNARDFSPFEFIAHDINESKNSESLWEEYEAGVQDGIKDIWREIVAHGK